MSSSSSTPTPTVNEDDDEAPRPFLNEDWGAALLGIGLVLLIVFGILTKGVWQ